MKLELNDKELSELKRLLKDLFISYRKYRSEITDKTYYSSMIIEEYNTEQMINLRALASKVLTPEELMELEKEYRLHHWGQWFPE